MAFCIIPCMSSVVRVSMEQVTWRIDAKRIQRMLWIVYFLYKGAKYLRQDDFVLFLIKLEHFIFIEKTLTRGTDI